MRWGDQRQSTNIEDRRGIGGRGIALGGGGIGVLILAAIVCLLGGDPRQFLESQPQVQQQPHRRTKTGSLSAQLWEASKTRGGRYFHSKPVFVTKIRSLFCIPAKHRRPAAMATPQWARSIVPATITFILILRSSTS